MKALIIFSFILLFAPVVSGQKLYIDTAKQNYINAHYGVYSGLAVFVGQDNIGNYINEWYNNPESFWYSDETGELMKPVPQKLRIDTIGKKQFDAYKKAYKTRINTDSAGARWTDTSFILTYETKNDTFTANKNDYSFFEYYLGFIEPLNLYMVHSISGANEVGVMLLADKKTGKNYIFDSPSDYPIEQVRVSPKQTGLLGYVNDMYDDYCFLSFLNVNKNENAYTLEGFYGLRLYKTSIKELLWIDETTITFAATAGYSDEYKPLPVVYLKGTITK